MASKVTRDHHSLRRNLKLNGNYVSNDGGDEGLSVSDAGAVSTSGALTVGGDFTVNGTTTTVNSTTLQVDDKMIELAHSPSGSEGADASVDGGGITLKSSDSDKTILWTDSTDQWHYNQGINITSGNLVVADNIDLEGSIDVNGTSNLDAVDIDGTLTQDAGNVVFNEDSGDYDFRVESNGNANMLFVDGGNDRVGIGTAAPGAPLTVIVDGGGGDGIQIAQDANYIHSITNYFSGTAASNYMAFDISSGSDSQVDDVLVLTGAGNVGIGAAPTAAKLEVHGGRYNTSLIIKGSNSDTGIKFVGVDGDTDGYVYADGGAIGFLDDDADWAVKAVTDTSVGLFVSNTIKLLVDANSRISLSNNDSGADNTVFGFLAGAALASGGDDNVLIGDYAGTGLVTGSNNIAIGSGAFDSAVDDESWNVAIGVNAMGACDQGSHASADIDDNVAIGYNALLGGDLGSGNVNVTQNVVVGYNAMDGTGTLGANNNVFMGAYAGGGTWATAESNFNVAIGHSAMTGAMNASNYNNCIGYLAGTAITTGDDNSVLGAGSLEACTTGSRNVAIGSNVLDLLTTGSDHIFIGYDAGTAVAASQTTTDGSIGIGRDALKALTSGANNLAVGYLAGKTLTTGAQNLAIGREALENHVLGESNIAIGYLAMGDTGAGSSSYDSDHNTFIGLSSGGGAWADVKSEYNVGVGNYTMDGALNGALNNTAVGYGALTDLTYGDENVAVGHAAGADLTIGRYNTAFGTDALRVETVGDGSVAFGHNALKGQISDSNNESTKNTGLGYQTGYTNVTGTSNTYAGYRAGFGGSGSESSNTAVGAEALLAITTGDGNTVMGNSAADAMTDGTGNVAMGVGALGASTSVQNAVAIGYTAMNANATTAANGTIAIGYQALNAVTTGGNNTAVGYTALAVNTTGANNTAIGHSALSGSQNVGDANTAVGSNALVNFNPDTDDHGHNSGLGYEAGASTTTGTENTYVGSGAGYRNATGDNNTYVGYAAGKGASGQSHASNTAVGKTALTAITTGGLNVAMGLEAGLALLDGHDNVFVGAAAGVGTTTIGYATAIGRSAMRGVATAAADGTVAVGYEALKVLTEGVGNVAIGYQALDAEDDGDFNTAVGYQALTAQTGTSGTVNNTAVGYQAGDSITSGTKNTILGASSDANSGNAINQTCVGANVTGVADYSVTLGDSDVTAVYMASDSGASVYCGKVGVGTTSPDAMLEVENSTINTDHYTASNSMTGLKSSLSYTGASSKEADSNDNFFGAYISVDFADGQGSGVFGNVSGAYNEAIARNCSDGSGSVYGTYSYGLATTNQYDIDNIWASKSNCLLESGGAIDANVYGGEHLIDCDNAAIAGTMYATRTAIDVDGGSIGGYMYGHIIDINTTVNPSGDVRGLNITMAGAGMDATGDLFFLCHDGVNDDVVAQITAVAGVATFDSGDFSGAPDYAEYFESKDGKPIDIGKTVKLDGDKIVACSDGDTPIGVVRPKASSAVVANAKRLGYQGKYLKSEYDEIIMEDYKLLEWQIEISYDDYKAGLKEDSTGGSQGGKIEDRNKNKEGDTKSALENQIYIREYSFHKDRVPKNITVPDDAKELTPNHQRKKLNPDYDSSKEYKSRPERDEWCLVGLLGQIPITKGQPVASNWIKMKDVSDTVEMYFVK